MANRETDFDWKVLDALFQRGCSAKDAAAIMDCSVATIERRLKEEKGVRVAEYKDGKLATTRLKLQEKAIDMASKGDRVMLIFCLKNLCNWTDNKQAEILKEEHKGFGLNYPKNPVPHDQDAS